MNKKIAPLHQPRDAKNLARAEPGSLKIAGNRSTWPRPPHSTPPAGHAPAGAAITNTPGRKLRAVPPGS